MFYVNIMVPTKQKPTIGSQMIKRREVDHATIKNLQLTKEGNKRERKNGTITQPEIN